MSGKINANVYIPPFEVVTCIGYFQNRACVYLVCIPFNPFFHLRRYFALSSQRLESLRTSSRASSPTSPPSTAFTTSSCCLSSKHASLENGERWKPKRGEMDCCEGMGSGSLPSQQEMYLSRACFSADFSCRSQIISPEILFSQINPITWFAGTLIPIKRLRRPGQIDFHNHFQSFYSCDPFVWLVGTPTLESETSCRNWLLSWRCTVNTWRTLTGPWTWSTPGHSGPHSSRALCRTYRWASILSHLCHHRWGLRLDHVSVFVLGPPETGGVREPDVAAPHAGASSEDSPLRAAAQRLPEEAARGRSGPKRCWKWDFAQLWVI